MWEHMYKDKLNCFEFDLNLTRTEFSEQKIKQVEFKKMLLYMRSRIGLAKKISPTQIKLKA